MKQATASSQIMASLCCSYADITVHLLYTTSFATLEEVKKFKFMRSYKYFTAGWVIHCKWKFFKDACLVAGKVNHSYATSSPPLRPWVIIRNSGTLDCGESADTTAPMGHHSKQWNIGLW